MTKADRQPFGLLLAGLAASYREELDEAALEGYWLALSDLDLPALKRAATTAARTLKFMPKAAELRELTGEFSLNHRAILAFDNVCRAVETVGGYRSVTFDDPAINAAIRAMGGWPELCNLPEKDFHGVKAAQFEKYYKAFASASPTAEQAAHLPGYYERENRLHGHAVEPPVKIQTGLPVLSTVQRVSKDAPAGLPAAPLPRLELAKP